MERKSGSGSVKMKIRTQIRNTEYLTDLKRVDPLLLHELLELLAVLSHLQLIPPLPAGRYRTKIISRLRHRYQYI